MPPCNGDCNQGRECICECKKETNMVTVPLDVLEDMQRRLKGITKEEILGKVFDAVYAQYPTQEPVLYIDQDGLDGHATWAQATRCQDSDIALYTHPPKQWQGLSDDEIEGFINPLPQNIQNDDLRDVISAIEAKLRENNNG